MASTPLPASGRARAPEAAAGPAASAHRTLLPFALALVASNIVLQLVIVASGNRITVISTLLLALIALGYAVYLLSAGRRLSRVRYGLFVAHALTYATVNTGFLLHAWVLFAIGSPAIAGGPGLPMDPRWFGVTLSMAAFWGLGLVVHGLGSVLSRGYEETRA